MKYKITEDEVSLELDLREVFGRSVPDEGIRARIADDVVEIIQKRTLRGFGVEDGKIVKFKKYSKAYAQKKGQTNVDLELGGGMLGSLERLSDSPSKISVGIVGEAAPRAHGHMTGQYGEGPLPRRSFLGLTAGDLKTIQRKYKPEVQGIRRQTAADFSDNVRARDLGITREDIADALNRSEITRRR